MNITIRADSSTLIGTGHIMRCLTLADKLRKKGCAVTFVCQALPGNINNLIVTNGFTLQVIPAAVKDCGSFDWERDAAETASIIGQSGAVAWLIVDHYRLDWRWQQKIHSRVGKIMVIDDLADRKHDCDILLDQNFYPNLEYRYRGLVPEACRCFLGPRYSLLREEFLKLQDKMRIRDGKVRRILVFFGGSDPTNETMKALAAIKESKLSAVAVDVVVGGANSQKDEVRRFCDTMTNTVFHCQINNMAELMDKADLAIGAGGSTTWERCYIGLPCLTIIIADNQAETTAAVAGYGAVWNMGWHAAVTAGRIAAEVRTLLATPVEVKRVSETARSLMHGHQSGIESLITEIQGNGA